MTFKGTLDRSGLTLSKKRNHSFNKICKHPVNGTNNLFTRKRKNHERLIKEMLTCKRMATTDSFSQKRKRVSVLNSNNSGCQIIQQNSMPFIKHKISNEPVRISSNCKNEPNKEKQTFIDCGQREFDTRRCNLCGMVYAPGERSDEAHHNTFCNSSLSYTSLALGRCKDHACIVERQSDGSNTLLFRYIENHRKGDSVFNRLIKIKDEIVDPSMGFSSEDFDKTSRDTCPLLFAHVSKENRLMGLMYVERITSIHRAQSASVSLTGEVDLWESFEGSKPILGVRQIWVAANERRKGVAAMLLDVARRYAVYGYVVARDEVCFSQPTEQGAHFAVAYNKKLDRKISIYQL